MREYAGNWHIAVGENLVGLQAGMQTLNHHRIEREASGKSHSGRDRPSLCCPKFACGRHGARYESPGHAHAARLQ
jgi:hypothetical protein